MPPSDKGRRRAATDVRYVGIEVLAAAAARLASRRRDKPWLAVVAAPLAMTALALLGAWWAWPMLLWTSWMLTPGVPLGWPLAGMLALTSTAWSYAGIGALSTWPGSVTAELVWVGFPLLMAIAGAANRHLERRPSRK